METNNSFRLEQSARRLFDQIAQATADPPGVTRDSYGDGEARAHAIIVAEAQRIGLEYKCNDFGNLYVALPGLDRNAPVLMTGSHLDSVPHGVNCDGAAGVLAGLALLETFAGSTVKQRTQVACRDHTDVTHYLLLLSLPAAWRRSGFVWKIRVKI